MTSRPRTCRLFVALRPDPGVTGLLWQHEQAWTFPAGCLRYTRLDWHVTLHFLGSVPLDRVASLAEPLAISFDPFDLVLDQPRLWPRGLAVLCASRVPDELRTLHERLGDALQRLDHAVDTRVYRPHLTFARRAAAAIPPRAAAPIVWPVRSFDLVVSTGQAEHRYESLCRYLPGGEAVR